MKINIEKQESINLNCMLNCSRADDDTNFKGSTWKKFRSCSAEVLEKDNYVLLRSYNTIVAVIDLEHGIGYDFLRLVYGYTATSAQHIFKFFKDYGVVKVERAYPIYD